MKIRRPAQGRRKVYYSNDFVGGELVTHAENTHIFCGYSKMGEALIAGVDVHSALAATMMGVSYELFCEMLEGKHGPEKKKLAKAFRQAAKPGNFGFPGRMGAARMVGQQREQGPDTDWPGGPHDLDGLGTMGFKGLRFCLLIGGAKWCGTVKVTEHNRQKIAPTCKACIDCAEWIKSEWMKQWPENHKYLKEIVPAFEEQGWVEQHYSKRIRGADANEDFGGSIANGFFQAFLADITGRAQVRVSFEQYVRVRVTTTEWPSAFAGEWSPLYGSRSQVFAHDELFGETDEEVAPEVSERINEIMVEEFKKACRRHERACKAQPTLMRRWYKEAQERRHCVPCDKAYSDRRDCKACGTVGRLMVWEPEPAKKAA